MSKRLSGLLVSVRSASEAVSAVNGGASVIDVKEPDRGPLGMADFGVWRDVRSVVPQTIPVSVALGELTEWIDRPIPDVSVFEGIGYRKIGLARSGMRWGDDWKRLRDLLGEGPEWIAVIYSDWVDAEAPDPDSVIDAARDFGCSGVLIDTWNKTVTTRLDRSWIATVRRIKQEVGMVALAGGLDERAIAELRSWQPDLFAVRGAACEQADRRSVIATSRVASLSKIVASAL